MGFLGGLAYLRSLATDVEETPLKAAVRSQLLASPAVADLVGDRVRGVIAQRDVFPAIKLTVIANTRGERLAGYGGWEEARIQLDCLSRLEADCAKLKVAIEDCLDTFHGDLFGLRVLWCRQLGDHDMHEPPEHQADEWLYRIVCEYRVKYRFGVPTA